MNNNSYFKKGFRFLCLFLPIACCLTGCHGSRGKEPFTIPEELDETTKLEITFWAKNDTNKAQTKVYEEAISDFEKLYPNIKIALRLYTDYGRIYNDVITNIATDTTPNVCITYPDHIATYMTGANVVVPLDELMTDEKYGMGGKCLKFDAPAREEIVPQFLEECMLGDSYYALPFMRSTEVCYVNKTFVEALGYELPKVLTWDYIWEVSEAAVQKDENGLYRVNGQKVMIPFIYKSTDNMMISYLKQRGAGYSTAEGEVELFNEDTKEFLYRVSEHAGTGAFSTFKISGYPANFLNAGQCIFAVDSTAGATWMGAGAPLSDISPDKFVDFETEVLPIPQYDPENPKMISQGPSVCIFNKDDPQEVLYSWLFVQYLLSNKVQIAYGETEGYVPVTLKAQNAEEYRDYMAGEGTDDGLHYGVKIRAARLLVDHAKETFITPVFNGSASLRDGAGQLVENTVKSTRRKETIDEAYMNRLFLDVTSLYRLDRISISGGSGKKSELGPLPAEARLLLGGLLLVWLLMIAYASREAYKSKKSKMS